MASSSSYQDRKIAVIGLGYVGLPVALAFAKRFPGTIGFDVNRARIDLLARGIDSNRDLPDGALLDSKLRFTSEPDDLKAANFFVVAVPTPIDDDKRPDLGPLESASRIVGEVISPGSIVVFESTVYPGVTEEICGPLIAEVSGLTQGVQFKLGYSPERINPGDHEHTLERIVKVVSGEDEETLEIIARVYGEIITAGLHRANSIKVAEAAKVIENTQRDLNIALMNELALIFDQMDISTTEVIEAAATKWNFLRFKPGLVGGHCIGVDPYYLTAKAEKLGYLPQVILAGRRINDGMGQHVAQKTIKLMSKASPEIRIRKGRVGILGLTFKEDVSDTRNSQVPSIIRELREFGIEVLVCDPLADGSSLVGQGIKLVDWEELSQLDALILAVCHQQFLQRGTQAIESLIKQGGVIVDVKAVLDPQALSDDTIYWRL